MYMCLAVEKTKERKQEIEIEKIQACGNLRDSKSRERKSLIREIYRERDREVLALFEVQNALRIKK